MEEDYDGLLEMLLEQTGPIDGPPSPPPIDLQPPSELDLFLDPSARDKQDQRPSSPNPSNSAGNFMVNDANISQALFSMGPFPMRTGAPSMPATTITHSAISVSRQTYQYKPILPSYQKYRFPNMASSSFLPFFSMQSHSPTREPAWPNPKLNPTQNGVGATSSLAAKPHIFKCTSCNLQFPNAQAYGGHMSSHSKSGKSGTSFALSVIQNLKLKRTRTKRGSTSKGKKPTTSSTKESSISDGVESNEKKEDEVLRAANSNNKEKSTSEQKEEEDGNRGNTNDNHPIEEKQIENFGNIGDGEEISGIFDFADESLADLWNCF